MQVLLTGFQNIDNVVPKNEPDKTIDGVSLYLAVPASSERIIGFIACDNGGKRFITRKLMNKCHIDLDFLTDHLCEVIDVEVDFNGRVTSISACSEV